MDMVIIFVISAEATHSGSASEMNQIEKYLLNHS